MRRAAKRDDNEPAIVDALRAIGCSVAFWGTDGAPDLVVGYRGRTVLLEVKDGRKVPSKRHLTGLQAIWHETWRGGALCTVQSVDEAIKAVCGDV